MGRTRFRGLVPAVALGASLAFAACGRDGPPVATKGGIRSLAVKGSPFEMGDQQGRALKAEIHEEIERRLAVAWRAAGPDAGDPGFLERACRSYASLVKQRLPESVRQELLGIASGAGVGEDDVLLLEVQREGLRWHGTAPRTIEAGFASPPADGGDDGAEVVAAYEGWREDAVEGSVVLLSRTPEDGVPTLVLTWPGGLGAFAGVSPRLVAVQAEVGLDPGLGSLSGPPFGIGFRVALERATSIADFWERLPGLSGNRVVVADRAGARRAGIVARAKDPSTKDDVARAWVLAPAGRGGADDPRTAAQDAALGRHSARPGAGDAMALALSGRAPSASGPVVRASFRGIDVWLEGAKAADPSAAPLSFPFEAGK